MSGQASVRFDFNDGLASVITGAGTSVDRKQHRNWQERSMNPFMVDTAYRGSWLMRKIIDIPAKDATRAGLDWQADADDIELIEAEEKRLRVKEAMRAGLILGRLGGGVVVMGLADGKPADPLPDNVQKGGLRYLRHYSRQRIKLGPRVTDPGDDDFGEPEYFIIKSEDGEREVTVHRDRVLVFKGRFAGHVTSQAKMIAGIDAYWGESEVHAVNDAVMNAVEAQDEIATLISEAKIDVFGIPELMNMMGDAKAEARVMRRLEIAHEGKSLHRALIKDEKETFDQRQITWGGMRDIILCYVSLAGAAGDIPATRLLAKSPDGMNATGEADQENYDQLVKDIQSDRLAPNLDKLHRALIPSAIGSLKPEIYYEFAPLHDPNPAKAAEVEAKEAATYTSIVNLGLIPEEAIAQAIANRMIESGRWPGLDTILKELGDDWWKMAQGDATEEEDDTGQGGRGGDNPGGSGGDAGGTG